MTLESQAPRADDLPSSRQLAQATLGAAVVAAALLVVAVLPAEYGIDPTGAGRAMGLTAMGELKHDEVAPVAARSSATDAPARSTARTFAPTALRTEKVTLTLAPNAGTEVKATMRAGEEFDYRWSTDGGDVHFELHGEKKGDSAGAFTSYEKGSSKRGAGTFRAPFDGTHGWYWRNRADTPVTITVTATGVFERFAQLE